MTNIWTYDTHLLINFQKKKNPHFLGTTLVTSSSLVMSSNIHVINDVIAHVLHVRWSQTITKSDFQCHDIGILIVQIGRKTKKLWCFENGVINENFDYVICKICVFKTFTKHICIWWSYLLDDVICDYLFVNILITPFEIK